MVVKSINGGATFSKPLRVSGVALVRSGHVGDVSSAATASRRWRSTGRAASISPGRIAGYATVRSDPLTGDSRIVISTSTNGRDVDGAARDAAGRASATS